MFVHLSHLIQIVKSKQTLPDVIHQLLLIGHQFLEPTRSQWLERLLLGHKGAHIARLLTPIPTPLVFPPKDPHILKNNHESMLINHFSRWIPTCHPLLLGCAPWRFPPSFCLNPDPDNALPCLDNNLKTISCLLVLLTQFWSVSGALLQQPINLSDTFQLITTPASIDAAELDAVWVGLRGVQGSMLLVEVWGVEISEIYTKPQNIRLLFTGMPASILIIY